MIDKSQYNPIRTDASNTFAHNTMKTRLPQIVDDVIARNTLSSASIDLLQRLRDQLRSGQEMLLPFPSDSQYTYWSSELAKRGNSLSWLNAEWLFAEPYFFNLIMTYSNYWSTGIDPFFAVKRDEIHRDDMFQKVERLLEVPIDDYQRLNALLEASLWGNRADLSHPSSLKISDAMNPDDLLVDERDGLIEAYSDTNSAIHIITDNAGTELAMDLLLASHFIYHNRYVLLHVKMQPTYVSDATPYDVRYQIEHFPHAGTRERLLQALHDWKLVIVPDFVWNSAMTLEAIMAANRHKFVGAGLVIVKGDANYRRALNDTIYPVDTPMQEIVNYMPAPTLFLRTLKSDPLCGLSQDVADKLDIDDAEWRVNGQRGVIQFVK